MKRCTLAILAVLAGAATCFADAPEPSNFYKLEFVLKEMDGGKVMNSRTYTATVGSDKQGCSIRTGSKVPVQTTGGYTTIEVGINIDCSNVQEVQAGLSVIVRAETTSIPQESPQGSYPVVRENRWNSTVVVPLRKPTVIFSSDDVTSKHQMQVELTAVPIK